MAKQPVISGQILVKYLVSNGFYIDRQKGSHISLKYKVNIGEKTIVVPLHDNIAKGTLNDIVNKISEWIGKPKDIIYNELSD